MINHSYHRIYTASTLIWWNYKTNSYREAKQIWFNTMNIMTYSMNQKTMCLCTNNYLHTHHTYTPCTITSWQKNSTNRKTRRDTVEKQKTKRNNQESVKNSGLGCSFKKKIKKVTTEKGEKQIWYFIIKKIIVIYATTIVHSPIFWSTRPITTQFWLFGRILEQYHRKRSALDAFKLWKTLRRS